MIVSLSNILLIVCIAAFSVLFFTVVFFRFRVLNAYHTLVKNKVQFEKEHVFNRQKLEAEILPKYPNDKENILKFVDGIHFSIKMVTVLTTIITIFAGVLIFMTE